MRVYRCDRCGKFVSLKMRDYFLRNPTPLWRFGRKIHLCGDCARSFCRWFSEPKAKEVDDAERRD